MSSNYFYIFFILLSFSFLYIVTIYLQTLFAFKKDYAKYKCNPIMMPFSAAFGENPKDVFNECIGAEQTKTTDKFTAALFSNLESNDKNMETTNNMNAGVIISQGDFKNKLLGNDNMSFGNSSSMMGSDMMGSDMMGSDMMGSNEDGDEDGGEDEGTGLIPALGEAQKNISIQTTRMAVASKNVTDVLMANIKGILILIEAIPIIMKQTLNSPPIQMVKDIGAMAGK